MGVLKATVMFLTGLITIVVVLLVADPIVGNMTGYLSPSVILLCGSMLLIVVILLFYRYIIDAQNPEDFNGTPDVYIREGI